MKPFGASLNATTCFCAGYTPSFGNGFLSTLLVNSWTAAVLPPHGSGENRGILHLEIPHPLKKSNSLRLFLTHLDHTQEAARVGQLKDALNFVNLCSQSEDGTGMLDDHIIMGDLNAASEGDYTPPYLESINQTRFAYAWGKLTFDATTLLKELGYVDAVKVIHPDLQDKSIVTSSKSGLRIDYIWLSPGLAEKIDWEKTSCTIHKIDWTDHYPIELDLVFKQ